MPVEGLEDDALGDFRCHLLAETLKIAGASWVTVVSGDLFKRSSEIPWAKLKSMVTPGKLAGAWALETLAEDMATKNTLPVANTFARAQIVIGKQARTWKSA